jgi:hypothetical protein
MRTIYLPAIERSVTLPAYLKAVKTAIANPGQTFKHGLSCWWPIDGAEIRRQFFAGVQDRINQAIPYTGRGRL